MSKLSIKNLDLYYGDFKALKNVNLEIEANKITAFIGPSGCGKSSKEWMSICSEKELEWFSRSQIHFQ